MAGNQSEPKERLTLWEALKDFGWLPLSLISIGGGLALIDIAERLVAEGLSLSTPFQIALDGYRRVAEVIAAVVEPNVQPAIDWVNAHWHWHLRLEPHWRSLFVLAMVFVTSLARTFWRDGHGSQAMLALFVMGPCLLVGTVMVGLVPLTGAWWVQGLMAGLPIWFLFFGLGATYASFEFLDGDTLSARRRLVDAMRTAAYYGITTFLLGAGLSLRPPLGGSSTGLLTLCLAIAFHGVRSLASGLKTSSRTETRFGLSVLGGYYTAGLVLLSNWAVTALS